MTVVTNFCAPAEMALELKERALARGVSPSKILREAYIAYVAAENAAKARVGGLAEATA